MSSTKNIAKNSMFLYFRMFINMLVGLCTAGIVLNTLGISDYGIYNVVGGFVSMFGFLNSSMSSATQRFLSFDIGRNDQVQLGKTFSTTVTIHFVIALVIVLALETFGLLYINHKLNVPAERITAVNVVFQFSVWTFFFGIIQVPYNALITAHERFNVYAYISFLEIGFKLCILFLITHIHYDKLILYSFLLFCSSFITRMIYRIYCKRNFTESKYQFYFNKTYFKEIFSFTGWNLFGDIASVANGQGNNMLLNSFFGTTINAAYGISGQVNGLVNVFVTNFQMAVNPQIIKTYANNRTDKTMFFMRESAKLSFFLVLIITMPVLYNLHYILTLWLKKFPDQTISFIQISMISVLLNAISNPLMVGARATGKIKWYQVVVGSLVFLSFPLSYIGLKITNNPNIVFIMIVVMGLITLGFRLWFLQKMINLNIRVFVKEVLLKIVLATAIILILHYLLFQEFGTSTTIINLILMSLSSVVISISVIMFFGITKQELNFFKTMVKKKK